MKQVTAVAIGYGSRGQDYAQFATKFPDQYKIVGVAEPRKFQREKAVETLSIAEENVFNSWKDVAKQPKFADCVVITTQDQMHRDPAVAFAKMGYHILLEKPMATTYEDCVDIVDTCKQNNVILAVCHVLRYTPEAIRIRELIQSGVIGDVMNIQLLEPVGFWHYAHSYVRGNWRNSKQSTFSLLAKCCHDIDLIRYWVGEGRCQAVSSFGTLHHFSKDQKEPGAGTRCLECAVEEKCPYSAKKIYLDQVKKGHRSFPLTIVADVPDVESIEENLRTGPYGRCVCECDNDVMENQVVIFQFEGGVTVNFSMVAFTEQVGQRQTKIFGTKQSWRNY